MNVQTISGTSSAARPAQSGFSALGQGDFLRLMTEQLKQQDPFAPVDNKEMLAQMAQFSSLAGIAEMGDTLKSIASKLDSLAAAQTLTSGQAGSSVTTNPTSTASTGS